MLDYFSPRKLRSNSQVTPNESEQSSDKINEMYLMLKELIPDVKNIKQDISKLKADFEELTKECPTNITGVREKCCDLENKLSVVSSDNKNLQMCNNMLRDKLNTLELYSRRQNLIFHNIKESQTPLTSVVQTVLTNMGIRDAMNIDIDDIHRIGPKNDSRPRPIIVRFLRRADRLKVWEARTKLKGTQIILDEDFPNDYKEARNALRPAVKAAKDSGHKATLINDKILIDGQLYGVNDTLPHDCNPDRNCQKENDSVVCFFGRHSPLSNFYQCKFKVDGKLYTSVEQFLHSKRAEIMGDEQMVSRMMSVHDPSVIKRMSKSVKGDNKTWNSVAKETVMLALIQKFHQNQDLKVHLMSTGDKCLGEASLDKAWGIGSSLNNPRSLDKSLWEGNNWLGELLMRVRHELKHK